MILYPPFLKRGICLAPSLILMPRWAHLSAAYLAHEQVHAGQQRSVGALTFWYRYLTDKAFRKQAEVEAYKVQIAAGANHPTCAHYLADRYRMVIDYTTAYDLLRATPCQK